MNRTDVLNHLADKYKLENYLEIGVQNPMQNFDKVRCPYKLSVDPDPNAHASFCMTSDDYFEQFPQTKFDLIFIDGLHTSEQVKKDFENALKILSPSGFIVLHDCNPEKEEYTIVPRPTKTGHWNGDVYKFALAFNQSEHVFTVDVDNGCMVIRAVKGELKWFSWMPDLPWSEFDTHRKQLLHLISWDEFIKL